MQSSTLEVVQKQCDIIQIQSEIIGEMYMLLQQHIQTDELEKLPCVGRMNLTREMKRTIE